MKNEDLIKNVKTAEKRAEGCLPHFPLRLRAEDGLALKEIMTKTEGESPVGMLRRLIHEELARLQRFEQEEQLAKTPGS